MDQMVGIIVGLGLLALLCSVLVLRKVFSSSKPGTSSTIQTVFNNSSLSEETPDAYSFAWGTVAYEHAQRRRREVEDSKRPRQSAQQDLDNMAWESVGKAQSYLDEWLRKQRLRWNHQDWLSLIDSLRSQFGVVYTNHVGLYLETRRAAILVDTYWNWPEISVEEYRAAVLDIGTKEVLWSLVERLKAGVYKTPYPRGRKGEDDSWLIELTAQLVQKLAAQLATADLMSLAAVSDAEAWYDDGGWDDSVPGYQQNHRQSNGVITCASIRAAANAAVNQKQA